MSALLQRLAIVFGQPNTEWPDRYVDEVAKLIRGFAEPEQQKAADLLIREHKWWPKPSEIVTACVDAREILHAANPRTDDKKRDKTWTADALKRADSLIQSEMGQTAADEGWVLSLWDFCRKHERLPRGAEVSTIKRDASEFDEAYAKACAGGWGQAAEFKHLGDLMLARRKQKAAWAYGEVIDRKISRKDLAAGETE